jgi:hypothetical protein
LPLIFCEPFDHAALWAAARLRERGISTELITADDLAAAERWEHRVGASGATIEIQLADGRRVSGGETRGVLNRLSFLPAAWLQRIGGPDRDYAVQEMYALYISWLHALPGPVLNPPQPQGLCGNWRHRSMWSALAGRAGLPTPPYRQSSDDDPSLAWQPQSLPAPVTAFTVGSHVVAPPVLPLALHDACRRLSEVAGAPLLGVDFTLDPYGAWCFAEASVMPDLMRGGEPLIDAIAETLAA